ncbi:uncharacterized protein LOC143033040 [Oratosquilla oratoria]|uniref:uncharacterized protein LOC143033040 n=1 Tax=Oratosquilla oratoria TaxID=337810 RepID=UPI003F75723E
MCERVVLYERCLALQLVRTHPPPCPSTQGPPPPVQTLPPPSTTSSSSTLRKGSSHFTLGRNSFGDVRKFSGGRLFGGSSSRPASQCSEVSPPSGSSTPTPTNGIAPGLPVSPSKDSSLANKYQNGYLLFQAWQEANCACVWDGSLVEAVQASVYVGALVGGVLLLTGTPRVLATVLQAWVRTLLRPPIGFAILMLGKSSSTYKSFSG